MLPISEALWERPDLWLILALPVLGGLVGELGNWLSHRLLFGPLPRAGSGSASGNGILALHAEAVAGRLAAVLMPQLRLAELFRLMEPEKVATYVSSSVVARLDEYVDDIMASRHAVLWANLPQVLRQRIYARVGRQLPSILDNLLEDMAENVDELVDLSQLLDAFVAHDRRAFVALLEEALEAECRFLRGAGRWVGAGLGLLQGLLWLYLPSYPLLIGMSIAMALAVLLVPRALLLSTRSGTELSFWLHKDRARLPHLLGKGLAEQVLDPRQLMGRMMTGAKAARVRSMIRRHMRPLLEAGMVRTTLQVLVGAEGYAHIKQLVVEKAIASTAELLSDPGFNQKRAGAMQATCQAQLSTLPPENLRRLVQAILDEGLYARLTVLAGLGAIMGALQIMLANILRG